MSTARPTLWCLLLVALTTRLPSAHAQGSLCSLFTAAEITKLLGSPVESGEPLALATGCQWFGQDEESYVMVQVADTTHWIDPRLAPGYQAVQGVGKRAYSHPEEGGWRAMALTDKGVSAVVLSGDSAKREGALAILRRLVGAS